MSRIGRQVDHFKEIDPGSIRADFSPDRQYRFTLIMQFRDSLLSRKRSQVVSVILKNPSAADERRSDSTIRKVETYIWKHFPDARFLNILNLFGFRATDAREVNAKLKKENLDGIVGKDNDRFFREILSMSDFLVCAWGGPSGIQLTSYESRLTSVKEIILKNFKGPVYQVCGNQSTKEPLHGLMWSYEYQLKPFAP